MIQYFYKKELFEAKFMFTVRFFYHVSIILHTHTVSLSKIISKIVTIRKFNARFTYYFIDYFH